MAVETGAVRTCDKAFYVNQAAAQLALASVHEKAAKRGKRSRLPVRTYPCDVCDGWHLTSKVTSRRGTASPTGADQKAPGIFSSALTWDRTGG